MSLRPLIAICGTTGVGKSKLAIEIALALSQNQDTSSYGGYSGARIINADAMQVYAGMDIITNKVPQEEQCGVDHLLMGFKKPGEQYVVGQWVKDAIHLINETHQRNQLPIIVGGTSYWIQHLVFPGRLAIFDETAPSTLDASPRHADPSDCLAGVLSSLHPDLRALYEDLPEQLPTAASDPEMAFAFHRLLSQLDPVVAQRWHWKDTRKVLRSLRIIKDSGKLSSDIIREQSATEPPPRYRTLLFWLYARPDRLEPRLDMRVDHMLKQGLLNEVDDLLRQASSTAVVDPTEPAFTADYGNVTLDYTLGIYQSIGYREFSSYLTQHGNLSPSPEEKAFLAAVDRMKLSTRQYARRQVKWIRNKLLPAVYAANENHRQQVDPAHDVVPTFLLDATELNDKWFSEVQTPALHITQDFLQFDSIPEPISLSETARQMLTITPKPIDPGAVLEARRKVICPSCTVDADRPVMIEEGREWKTHVQTKRHRKLVTRAKQAAQSELHGESARQTPLEPVIQ